MKININEITKIIPESQIITNESQLIHYQSDESTIQPQLPQAVIIIQNTEQVVKIAKWANNNKIPLTARGGGSSLEGNSIPSKNSIVLDFSQMNRIIDVDNENLLVRCEPGVIFQQLNQRLAHSGLMFPTAPGGSSDVATIGGMASTNASGIYATKYGSTADWIANMQVVTGAGDLLKIGSRAPKQTSGYDLLRLFCGSEGTLGFITELELKLHGIPEEISTDVWHFDSINDATSFVIDLILAGLDIAAVELSGKEVVQATNKFLDMNIPEYPMVIVETHGFYKHEALTIMNNVKELAILNSAKELTQTHFAEKTPWEYRHFMSHAIKALDPDLTITRNDAVVPIASIPEFVEFCYKAANDQKLPVYIFGHLGVGIIHALSLSKVSQPEELSRTQKFHDEVLKKAIQLGGSISGEHGIGLGQKQRLTWQYNDELRYMKAIKKCFDPNNIANPDKIFSDNI
jgi:D-lactate dehydrogenase (cytochrome)